MFASQFIVAPYEADPQLAYLEKCGHVDAIITEDSDLLVFGCRNVIFKLDGEGLGTLICRDDFAKCREYNLAGWSDTEFRHMAILSGCDYLDSVIGLGLKTAYKLLRKYKTPEKVRRAALVPSRGMVAGAHACSLSAGHPIRPPRRSPKRPADVP